MHTDHFSKKFENKRVVVMGLGRFGGGLGVTRWLVDAGADVLVTDRQDADALNESLERLADLRDSGRLDIVHGEHDDTFLNDADVLVVNPAVPQPWNNLFIKRAQSLGVHVTTEIEIAYCQLDPARMIAVTGSAGKSTTSAMIHHALSTTGHHSILAGNIGGSLLGQLNAVTPDTVVILELSSAMLYWLWGRDPRLEPLRGPKVGCVTNCTPNHLDWHGGYTHYEESKKLLIEALPSDSLAILGESIQDWASGMKADVRVVHSEDQLKGCAVPGTHNATNAAMAFRAASGMVGAGDDSATSDKLTKMIRGFSGLPHRLNRCHQAGGIVFYDDSKSTVPEATCLAVEALSAQASTRQIHLIAGGYDKGSDLASIIALKDQLAGLYTIGDTGEAMARALDIESSGVLELAVKRATANAVAGDIIVLSPGCASWDQYANYQQRGEHFISLAKQHTQQPS